MFEVEQIAGKALGYPWYKDDQANFPGADEADGVCVGEHVAESIVDELAVAYARVVAEHERQVREAVERERSRCSWIADCAVANGRWSASDIRHLIDNPDAPWQPEPRTS